LLGKREPKNIVKFIMSPRGLVIDISWVQNINLATIERFK